MLGGSSKLYYFVTDEAADPDYTVASSYEATEVLTKPGEYRYKAIAQQFDEYNNLVAASGAVEGTFTVTSDQPAALKPATFVVKDAKGNDVVNEATVAEADGPVTITVTNPNADTSMDITLFDLNTENVVNSYIVIGSSEKVVEVSDPSSYVVSVVITRDPETANSEFMFTLEGTSQVVLNAPSVSFWGESDEFIDSATEADLPIDIIFTHDNWMNPQTEIVYSVNGGEEVVIEGYSAEYRITEPGEYAYSTYCRLGNVVSETTTGTFTVTAAAPTKATFAATDGNGDPVENNATVSVAPVTIVITNPAEGSAMDISVYNDGTGNSKSYASSDATYTIEVSDPGLNVVGVMVNDQYSEFAFTIEGEVEIPLTAPIVEFLDSDFNEVVSPADIADYGTILMSISHQNYMGAVEVVYTINGEEKVSSDYFTDIELTEPGTYEYSAYCRTSATNVSETVSGTFIITESEPGVKLNAPTITFSTPEGEDAPVTVTITNPNEEGTIVYTINDGAETAGEGNPVTFQLTEDGEYVVKAYVRNDADETLSSDVTTGNYSLSGIYAISFGAEGVKVIGGHIVAPEGAAVYNVNGVKVNTLDRVASGLYIVRLSNGTTAKVVVK